MPRLIVNLPRCEWADYAAHHRHGRSAEELLLERGLVFPILGGYLAYGRAKLRHSGAQHCASGPQPSYYSSKW